MESAHHVRGAVPGQCAVGSLGSLKHSVLRPPSEDRMDCSPRRPLISGRDFYGIVRAFDRRVSDGIHSIRHSVFPLRLHDPMAGNEQRRQRHLASAYMLLRASIAHGSGQPLRCDCGVRVCDARPVRPP